MSQCELLEQVDDNDPWIECHNEACATATEVSDPTNKIMVCMDCAQKLESEGNYTITYTTSEDNE